MRGTSKRTKRQAAGGKKILRITCLTKDLYPKHAENSQNPAGRETTNLVNTQKTQVVHQRGYVNTKCAHEDAHHLQSLEKNKLKSQDTLKTRMRRGPGASGSPGVVVGWRWHGHPGHMCEICTCHVTQQTHSQTLTWRNETNFHTRNLETNVYIHNHPKLGPAQVSFSE